MNNQQKINILMFSMSKYSDWQAGLFNRNYHILHTLAKQESVNKIITVDFFPFTFKKALKTYLKDYLFKYKKGELIYGDLTSFCWQVSSKILNYSSIDILLNYNRITSELKRIINEQNMSDNLIVLNYNPLFINYFHFFEQKLNIFDAVDNWLKHSSYSKLQNKLNGNYGMIKKNSDLIFTVSQSLQKELFAGNSNTQWIPNAVDLNYFQSISDTHPALKNIPKPIIGFLGILQDRIDTDLIEFLAQKNPDKSLVLAGPVWKNFPKNKLKQYKNIHFTGSIKGNDIPKLYNGFDVGMITYKDNDFIKSTDPMKFYEYLAAGLPIVSTPVPGLERFSQFVKIAKNPAEFNQQLNFALKEKRELTAEKINFLQENTWQKRVEQMLDLISQKL